VSLHGTLGRTAGVAETAEHHPTLQHRRYGSGPALVILHGLLGCRDNWHPVAKALSRDFSVYALDQRNHGHSFHSPRFDYPAMARDLLRFMDAHELAAAAVLGHSMGGKTAIQFAALHPQRVNRLVIVDITHQASRPAYTAAIEALLRLELETARSLREADERLAPEIPDEGLRRFLMKNLSRAGDGRLHWKVNLGAIHRHHAAICGPVAVPAVARPCLFVRGGSSGYIRDADWPEIRRAFPLAELVTVPRAGHWVHVDAKEAFLQAVSSFLKRPV
jgi:pimeloyl-ACP methyl ester carboxylesterase